MILFFGDSLAVGTPLADYVHQRVVKRAEVGIGTRDGVRRFLHPITGRVVVVSLGTNDNARPEAVRRPARRVKKAVGDRCLLWIEVSGVPNASRINRIVRSEGIGMIRWRYHGVHPPPSGYVRRAKRIARAVRTRC